jgi:GntR family transcriptional regulator/MocR family aminotransferase
VPVDEYGVHDEAIAAARCDLALITPAHQCPTGVVLTPGRRAALTAWAQQANALVVDAARRGRG